ncbi:XPA binding protein 1 [Salpingoeca rosetta]|uniref:GPN-loop GTPase n=1 Tax=Salpingoeca rosetta (strain ATCC 50818 / BSB-021) TaxID=946362 RepID=F2U1J0_SALR5|nr:XPA binding protein 1 [Salpingoeca rosetta]EGD81492.1 XPA binding protein 1 [Salpingoeca rosetta]|eukprot:XP_004996696.1 XPA binding protein 1 [Salpingoeca rosetta]
MATQQTSENAAKQQQEQEVPTAPMVGTTPCIICIGMAGSGKTSLVQRINAYLHQRHAGRQCSSATSAPGTEAKQAASTAQADTTAEAPTHAEATTEAETVDTTAEAMDTTASTEAPSGEASTTPAAATADRTPCYVLNLDPAVYQLPYEANIDIRETINYKAVMKDYGLGPNGAIVTCLNLFATKFDQVLSLMEKRSPTTDYFLFDTPGQIEVFTWSASGTIITETLGSSFPTVVVYAIDTPRCTSPVTFMSNMLYACSIMYKTRLPFIIVFNKVDVTSHEFAVEWMRDYETFRDIVSEETAYIGSMARSMGLVLEEFYHNLRAVGVSALTGAGMEDLFSAVDEAVNEYMTDFKPELDELLKKKEQEKIDRATESLTKLARDMKLGGKVVLDSRAPMGAGDGDDEDDVDSDDYDDLEDSARVVQVATKTNDAFQRSQGL